MTRDAPLAPLTTIGLGGRAMWLARCTDAGELRDALSFAAREGLPVQVFSGGSNIIFADEGFAGVVVNVALRGIRSEEFSGEIRLAAGAGEPWDGVVGLAVEKGWGGIECLSGIPGSTGGTPVQNVGAYGQEVAGTLTSVHALDRATLKVREFTRDECAFGYRESRFKREDADRFIITEVEFLLRRDRKPDIRYAELRKELDARGGDVSLRAVREAVIGLRRKKSMVVDPSDANSRSVGSFFTNPVVTKEFFDSRLNETPVPTYPAPGGVKLSAAWLVEHAGFAKGLTKNGAGISDNHALAIVNRGGRTADVLALAREIEEGVEMKYGVRLRREAVLAGTGRRKP